MNTPPSVEPSPYLPKQVLIALVRRISGITTLWRQDHAGPTPGLAAGSEPARVWLRVTSYVPVGTDDQQERYNASTDRIEVRISGQRRFTLSLRVESFGAVEPLDICERIRFRLRTQVARAIFVPARLALRDVQAIQPAEGKADGRTVKVGVMDVRWNFALIDDPFDPNEGDYIRTVNGNNKVPGTLNMP